MTDAAALPLDGRGLARWIAAVFDHPEDPEFYWRADPLDGVAPAVNVDAMTRVFAAADRLLAPYSDAQVAHGLSYLTNNACGSVIFDVTGDGVGPAARRAWAASLGALYATVFGPRCRPLLGHLSEGGLDHPLNTVCYMLWDVLPVAGGGDDRDGVDAALLDAMSAGLAQPNPACQESALHGLGHWARACPGEVERRIDRWLAAAAPARPELVAYARAARTGCVL